MRYRFAGTHVESLESGAPIVPGETVELDELVGQDKRLALVPEPVDSPPATPPASSAPSASEPQSDEAPHVTQETA